MYIYILELSNNKYYVGKTTNPNFRIESHFNNGGSEWTKKYKPIRLLELISNCDDYDEDKYTRIYMDKYGVNNVRGGSYVQIKLSEETINNLEKMNRGTNNKCFICGESNHFANKCPNKDKDIEDTEELYNKFSKDFANECKKLDLKNDKILTGENILLALNNNSFLDVGIYKVTNIYGLCQTINNCEVDNYICNYRNGINYEHFINGLMYILKNNPKICDECSNETKMCCCNKKKYSNKYSTYNNNKCNTYDNNNYDSSYSDDSDNSCEHVFCCEYCDKEFETEKGARYHENMYCKKKNNKFNKSKNTIEKDVFCCKYCDREFETEKGARYHENMYCKQKNNKSKNVLKDKEFNCYYCDKKFKTLNRVKTHVKLYCENK